MCHFHYIVALLYAIFTTIFSANGTTCHGLSGYENLEGKYYKLYGHSSHQNAQQTCENDGANLAMIKNEADFQAAKHFLHSKGSFTLLDETMWYHRHTWQCDHF